MGVSKQKSIYPDGDETSEGQQEERKPHERLERREHRIEPERKQAGGCTEEREEHGHQP